MTPTARLYPLEAFQGAPPPAPAWFRAAIDQQPDPLRLTVEGVEIEALSWGETGDPGVLLLHGAMANADWWRHIAPRLSGRRRITAISVSGMGRSGWRDAYSVDIHAREALAVAEATGLFDGQRKPTVVAHSFGGHVLVRLAADHGERFERGVILDSMAGSPTEPPRRVIQTGRFQTLAQALARFRLLPGQPAEPFILDGFGRRGLRTLDSGAGSEGFAWSFDPEFFVKFAPFEDGPALQAAKCPLVYLRGEHSAVCTPEVEARQRAAAPPGTRFVTLAEASHHLMADQPLPLCDTLERLLATPGAFEDAPAAIPAALPSLETHR